MKNINVSLKMVIGFTITMLLTLCICLLGVIGMGRLNTQTASLYDEVLLPIDQIGLIRETLQEQRVLIQELMLVKEDQQEVQRVTTNINANAAEMQSYLQKYQNLISNENVVHAEILSAENRAPFDRFEELYYDFFEVELNRFVRNSRTIRNEQVTAFIMDERVTEMVDAMNESHQFYSELSQKTIAEANNMYRRLVTVIIIAAVASLIICEFLTIYFPVTIARPLRNMVKVADAVSVGDMDMTVPHTDRGDEVGQLARAFERMKTEINKQIDIVEALSRADLSVEPLPRSAQDTLGIALVKLTDNLDRIISEVTVASDNVAQESRDVASQSQALAQGTTEQAASVEQLSSAFFEISLNTKESAATARKAAEVSDSVKRMATDGEAQMARMIQSIQDAHAASKNIDRIIRVIEEISFQTNILALNAAVEAAHAGQNGSGFAVVAAEVRSLASKSASSAKETGDLIADAMEKVQLGAEIAAKTSESFQHIVDGVVESTKFVDDIAKSSEEQAVAIEQINTGISQVAQVIHINSNAAEKCAAAAERMSKQSKELEDLVARFHTKQDRIASAAGLPATARAEDAEPRIKIDLSPSIPTDDFGKY